MKSLMKFCQTSCLPIRQYIFETLHYNFGFQFSDILEMAQVNNYENDGVFNKNKMKIQIYGGTSEHNPPHVHLMDKTRNFDIRVDIEEGDLISIKKGKKDSYSEIINDFKKWLNKESNNPSFKGKTNRLMCLTAWNMGNPDKMVEIDIENETI